VMTGRFTRLFPELPGASFVQADLERLAEKMTAFPEDEPPTRPGRIRRRTLEYPAGVHLSGAVRRP